MYPKDLATGNKNNVKPKLLNSYLFLLNTMHTEWEKKTIVIKKKKSHQSMNENFHGIL